MDPTYSTRHSEDLNFHFSENRIDIIDRPIRILIDSQFFLKISKIYFITPVSCDGINELRENIFFGQYGDTIYLLNTLTQVYETFPYWANSICIHESHLKLIIIGIAVILVVIISIVVIIIIVRKLRKRRAAQLMNIVQPEGRTYRETQIVMQIENAGLLKTDF